MTCLSSIIFQEVPFLSDNYKKDSHLCQGENTGDGYFLSIQMREDYGDGMMQALHVSGCGFLLSS